MLLHSHRSFSIPIRQVRCCSRYNEMNTESRVRGRPYARAISIKGLYAKMAKLSYIRQINRGNELLLLKESKVRLKVILSG